jgi:hypothetical protein
MYVTALAVFLTHALCVVQEVSLHRYRKAYKLQEHPTATREDLLSAIVRHFANIVSVYRFSWFACCTM